MVDPRLKMNNSFIAELSITNIMKIEYNGVMYRSNRSFNMPPRATTRAFDFFENYCSNSPHPGQNAVQMPHTRVYSGNQMPPPWGHFTGTKMTEERRKRLQLSNKIFINITKTEKHCQRIYQEQNSRAKRRKSLPQGH